MQGSGSTVQGLGGLGFGISEGSGFRALEASGSGFP